MSNKFLAKIFKTLPTFIVLTDTSFKVFFLVFDNSLEVGTYTYIKKIIVTGWFIAEMGIVSMKGV